MGEHVETRGPVGATTAVGVWRRPARPSTEELSHVFVRPVLLPELGEIGLRFCGVDEPEPDWVRGEVRDVAVILRPEAIALLLAQLVWCLEGLDLRHLAEDALWDLTLDRITELERPQVTVLHQGVVNCG